MSYEKRDIVDCTSIFARRGLGTALFISASRSALRERRSAGSLWHHSSHGPLERVIRWLNARETLIHAT